MLKNNSSDKNFQIVEILEVLPKTIIKQILNVLTIPWFMAINTSNDVQYTKLEHRKTWHMSQSVETSIIALIWSLVRISLFVWAVAQGRAKKSAKQQGRWDFFALLFFHGNGRSFLCFLCGFYFLCSSSRRDYHSRYATQLKEHDRKHPYLD